FITAFSHNFINTLISMLSSLDQKKCLPTYTRGRVGNLTSSSKRRYKEQISYSSSFTLNHKVIDSPLSTSECSMILACYAIHIENQSSQAWGLMMTKWYTYWNIFYTFIDDEPVR